MSQRTLKIITLALGAFLVLWGITGLYLVFDSRSGIPGDRVFEIEVRTGATLGEIADTLYTRQVVGSPTSFKIAARLMRRSRAIYPGRYTLTTNLTNIEALDALSHARAREITLTIPEGLRSDEIIQLLANRLDLDSLRFSQLLTDPELLAIAGPEFTHLEGTLFPDTYRFLENTTEKAVLNRLVRHFAEQIPDSWRNRAAEIGHNMLEIMTLASLIEKETALDKERRIIASVYHNRLDEGMLLNADPTLIYMLVQRGEWEGDLLREHKRIRDPYNTYRFRGLPPGPIANPGLAAIEAALYPDTTEFLYFVGKNDGTGAHDFSVTLRQHINKVNRYQRKRAGY